MSTADLVLLFSDINECASMPCANGGACTDLVNVFTCQCVAGYSGVVCQTQIDECASSPCANGGTCVDEVDSFTCVCADGYSGVVCQTDIDGNFLATPRVRLDLRCSTDPASFVQYTTPACSHPHTHNLTTIELAE